MTVAGPSRSRRRVAVRLVFGLSASSALVVPAPATPPTTVPVLLVPGWSDSARDLAALRIRLLGAGWADDHVEALTFEDPNGSNRAHADEIGEAVDRLLTTTGAEAVDVVAHSMGGLATRWFLMVRPDAPVRRVAFLGTPHRGTLSAHLAWGGGRDEMLPDSPLLDTLNARAPAPEGVEAITVRTRIDTHVVPGESASLPGVPDVEVCCVSHAGLLRDAEVFDVVRAFLERGAPPGGQAESEAFSSGPSKWRSRSAPPDPDPSR